jgi:RNA recognition motif-containing protein
LLLSGNAPSADSHLSSPSVTKQDIEEHFGTHGAGTIKEIKLMNGFGFIEYEDAMDARDVVPGKFLILKLG